MIKVRGIYEGTHVRLLEPVVLAPNTPVEVLIPEGGIEQRQEQAFLRRLVERGLLAPEWLMSSSREGRRALQSGAHSGSTSFSDHY